MTCKVMNCAKNQIVWNYDDEWNMESLIWYVVALNNKNGKALKSNVFVATQGMQYGWTVQQRFDGIS